MGDYPARESGTFVEKHIGTVKGRSGPFLTEEHEAFRAAVRRFVDKEIDPFTAKWDEAGEFPRELYQKAAKLGILGLGFPEEFGGVPCDRWMWMIAVQELARPGSGGVSAGLKTNSISAPPIVRGGSAALKARVLPDLMSGKKISALAISEPSAGSDVANLKTIARREGDEYVVRGEKTFITCGMRADYYTVAVRTGDAGSGGVSLLLIERDRPGFSRTPLKKMGWWASDTATLHFDDVRVPVGNLLGEENAGFKLIMKNFNDERLTIAAGCAAAARVCLEEAKSYARERHTFGKRLSEHQVIRHKLVDMAQKVEASQAMLEMLVWRLEQGESPVAEICMCKNQATQTLAFCASEAVQIFGGAGFMRGCKVERIYREVKVSAIGGGTEEIMKDLAARQMGL
ncbi:MAG: acyl-CoA dehydrogenase family protein [Legionella sp.]|nr:acyl-CoA dehydrogenase family protein [Legionella sp.]